MQMLGEAFKAEVAANGGKLPPLGVKTLVRLAGRLWLKRKVFHGKQKLGGLFGIQVTPALLVLHSLLILAGCLPLLMLCLLATLWPQWQCKFGA